MAAFECALRSETLASVFDISSNLRSKLLQAGELLFLANFSQKSNLQFPAINILVKIEEMSFEPPCGLWLFYGGSDADVCDTGVTHVCAATI